MYGLHLHHQFELPRRRARVALSGSNNTPDAPLWQVFSVLNIAEIRVFYRRILNQFFLHMRQFFGPHFSFVTRKRDKKHDWRSANTLKERGVVVLSLVVGKYLLFKAFGCSSYIPRCVSPSRLNGEDVAALFFTKMRNVFVCPKIKSIESLNPLYGPIRFTVNFVRPIDIQIYCQGKTPAVS